MLRVALLQAGSCGADLVASREKGLKFCDKAADLGADICVFPEMWSIGYAIVDDGFDAWQEMAVSSGDSYVNAFRDFARDRRMAIALTFLESTREGYRNSCALIDRGGEVLFVYGKVHTCLFTPERKCTAGNEFPVADLDTGADVVRVGAMICYDREFPESARVLALKGAELVVTPNACHLEASRLAQFRTRAFENAMACVMVNYPHVREKGLWPEFGSDNMNGGSVAYSPIAFDPPEPGGLPISPVLVDAGAEEGVYIAEIDMERIRRYRSTAIWGTRYRRPSTYGVLVERGTESVVEP